MVEGKYAQCNLTNKKVIPEIRFKGFTEPWEQRKLGDCFTERVESMPDGELISVTINDGIKKFSELGRHDNSNDDKSKYKKVCVGDIAYNSMRMWQGASGYSPYEGIVSPAYTVLSPNSGINSKCLAYQFKLPEMIHTFQINSQGITSDNWNLKYPALSEIEIFVSRNEKEQAKIAEYFSNLDNLITLHQRKYEKLHNIKKSMLEKMFPKNGSNVPEIRFKGFTEAWEQRKLDSLFEPLTERNNDLLPYNKTLSVATMTYKEVGNGAADSSLANYKRLRLGDIAFEGHTSKEFRYGRFVLNDAGDGIMSPRFSALRPISELPVQFWKYYIHYEPIMKRLLVNCTKAGTMMNELVVPEFLRETLLVPSTDEQVQIGQFLTTIDRLITLHQRELEKLQNIKQAMLEKMFI